GWLDDLAGATVVDASLETGVIVSVVARAESGARPGARATDAAYVFFTSGTTGAPKAIIGSHDGLSHFLAWQRSTFGIAHGDRVAQLSGLSFDVMLRDIFLPLTSGGTLCLPEDDVELDPDAILSWLARERITVLHTVPTVAHWWATNADT